MQPLNSINLSNTLWFKNLRKKNQIDFKTKRASSILREDLHQGDSGDWAQCSDW